MKHLNCLLVTLIVTNSINAQNWCPLGATWIYDTGSPWSASNTLIEYVGDTVIDGYAAQRFERSNRITLIMGFDTLIDQQGPEFYTRTNGDVVWEYNGTVWDTLYWFSAVPGDRWTPFWPYMQDCPGSYLLVIDTSTTVVDGIPLRTLDVLGTDGDIEFTFGAIMERIGGEFGGANFPGMASCSIIAECYCNRICYSDQDINSNIGCQLTLNVDEAVLPSFDLGLFPQPALDNVQISSTNANPLTQLQVTDARGKVVLNQSTNKAEQHTLAVEQLPAGYYILRTIDVTGGMRSVPLVIAR